MKTRRILLLSFIGLSLPALPALAQEQPRAIAPAMDATANLPMQRIGPEDLLALQVYDAPEFTRTVRVSSQGTIRLPMLKESIHVEGLFPNEVEDLIAQALQKAQLFVDPFVTVTIAEYHSRPISVAGAVKNPVIFQAIGTVTLLDALARAGGIAENAGPEIVVTRSNPDAGAPSVQRIKIKPLMEGTEPESNIKLTGGEEVRIPQVGVLVVAGNVTKPGVYPVLDGSSNTVKTAIAQAQGLAQFSAHVAYIYRPDEKGINHEIEVPLEDILKRRKPDVALQARDVLYIPDSSGRRITAQTLNALTGFATGTASGAIIYGAVIHNPE